MGVFAIYNDYSTDSTIIPNLFIDEYMKDANDAELKVYLYLLRKMNAGEPTSIGDIADRFNHTEREVVRSLRYWERRGLLVLQTDNAGNLVGIHLRSPKPASVYAADHQVIPITSLITARESGRGRSPEETDQFMEDHRVPEKVPSAAESPAEDSITADDLSGFQDNDSNRQLLLIVESYIGKPLSVPEMKIIYYISSGLHFSNELIDFLVDYCVGRGKKDFRYIEKVAVNWSEKGITTADQARKSIQSSSKSRRSIDRGQKKRPSDFNSFRQNSYDFDELEKQLLKQ